VRRCGKSGNAWSRAFVVPMILIMIGGTIGGIAKSGDAVEAAGYLPIVLFWIAVPCLIPAGVLGAVLWGILRAVRRQLKVRARLLALFFGGAAGLMLLGASSTPAEKFLDEHVGRTAPFLQFGPFCVLPAALAVLLTDARKITGFEPEVR